MAPKKTSASADSAAALTVALSSRRARRTARASPTWTLFANVQVARGEARVQRARQHRRRHALLDRGERGPAALAGVRHAAGELLQVGRLVRARARSGRAATRRSRCRGARPRRRPAGRGRTGTPRDRRAASSRRPPRGRVLPAFGVLEDVEALGVGGHHPVLDAVVDHLHEVAGAGRAAVQVALLAGLQLAVACRACAGPPRRRARALEDRFEARRRRRRRRRSSASSRARGPRRRRWCRRRRSGCPSRHAAWRGGCRRGSTSCRRRSRRRRRRAAAAARRASSRRRRPAPSARPRAASPAWRRSPPARRAPVAPSPASCCDGVRVAVERRRQSWPSRIRRRTMFAPIRPSPIMPSCIRSRSFHAGPRRRMYVPQ